MSTRRALLILAAAGALAGCARRARIEVTPVPGSKPPRAIVRCRATGLDVARVGWKLGSSVRQVGWNVPKDEAALLVQWTDGAPSMQLGITCTAEDDAGRKLSAGTSLAPPVIARAGVSASASGGSLVVEGSGFGAPLGDEDGVWLVQRGHVVRGNLGCPGATWDDRKIVACTPAGVTGGAEVRVTTGGKLAALHVELKP